VPLNPKQQRFVAEYLKDLNATQAAIRAGYSAKTARQQASDLLAKPDISDAVAKGTAKVCAKAEVSAEYVLSSLLNIAERCQQAVPVYVRVNGETRATGEYEFDSSGANKALELLGKHLALFTDKVDSTVKIKQPLAIRFVSKDPA
jgi:phage terminase small subunit